VAFQKKGAENSLLNIHKVYISRFYLEIDAWIEYFRHNKSQGTNPRYSKTNVSERSKMPTLLNIILQYFLNTMSIR